MSKSATTNVPGHARSVGQTQTNEMSARARQQFVAAVLNMSWQLIIVVLVPIIGGVELDKALKSHEVFLFIGLVVAVVGSILVMWRAMQAANRLPVPKLTPAQKRKVQKQYEEDDND